MSLTNDIEKSCAMRGRIRRSRRGWGGAARLEGPARTAPNCLPRRLQPRPTTREVRVEAERSQSEAAGLRSMLKAGRF